MSLHGWCIWFADVFAHTFPSRHFLVDGLDSRCERFGIGFEVARVPIPTARDHGSCVEEVFFDSGDSEGTAFKRVAGRKVECIESHLVGASVGGGVDHENGVVVVQRIGGVDDSADGSRKTGTNAEADVVESTTSNRPSSSGKFMATRLEGEERANAMVDSSMGLGRKKVHDASAGSI